VRSGFGVILVPGFFAVPMLQPVGMSETIGG
jgi:hypothetical protein